MPTDKELIPKAISICTTPRSYASVQDAAEKALEAGSDEEWPHNGCAANLSALLQAAGISVPWILGAGALANKLGGAFNSRGWVHVPVGAQQPCDVGVTFDLGGNAGADHIYFVITRVDSDEMVIADNQATSPHTRFASGKNGSGNKRTKTPTDYFLRAAGPETLLPFAQGLRPSAAAPGDLDFAPAPPAPVGAGAMAQQVAPATNSILDLAAGSEIAHYDWMQRGRAPVGYVKGMASAYARMLCKLKNNDPVAVEVTKPYDNDGTKDALTYYADIFGEADIPANTPEERLRQLFVLLMGLGMRESSGRWCEGRDRSANNVTAAKAEAGLFQTSWNAQSGSNLLPALFQTYAGRTDFLTVFKEGVRERDRDLENFGTGQGYEFQRLSKFCPAFAVEFAAVGLRNIRKHWGPITRREAEVKRKADAMYRQIAQLVDAQGLCPV
jgi:hypothetical protein